MGWLEAKHRRSEEKAEILQIFEIEKIAASRHNLYEQVSNLSYDKHNVSRELLDYSFLYLSDDTACSDYGTDTYQLAKENRLLGRVLKLETISPTLIKKHSLYEHLANTPASPLFSASINYSLPLNEIIKTNKNYEYKSCIIYPLKSVRVTLKHKDMRQVSFRNNDTMPDGLPSLINLDFSIISEKDFQDIRVLFLLVSEVS